MPGDSGATVVTTLVWFVFISHARLRVHRVPGIPHALLIQGRRIFAKPGRIVPREGGVLSQRHCLRQTRSVCARERQRRSNPPFCFAAPWIASLALAMTGSNLASSRTSERSERDPGPITTDVGFARCWSNIRFNVEHRWLWVPAFAGTTRIPCCLKFESGNDAVLSECGDSYAASKGLLDLPLALPSAGLIDIDRH
jgi:hypothetical protein